MEIEEDSLHRCYNEIREIKSKKLNVIGATLKLKEKVCSLCPTKSVHGNKNGKIIQHGEHYVHEYCLLFADSVKPKDHVGDCMQATLQKIKNASFKLDLSPTCTYCHEASATVRCCSPQCDKIFHLNCGILNQSMHQYFDDHKSYCTEHRLYQQHPHDEIDKAQSTKCTYCPGKINVTDRCTAMKSPCCHDSWFHRSCVEKEARKSRELSCPLCQNVKNFQAEMLKYGVNVYPLNSENTQEMLHNKIFFCQSLCSQKEGADQQSTKAEEIPVSVLDHSNLTDEWQNECLSESRADNSSVVSESQQNSVSLRLSDNSPKYLRTNETANALPKKRAFHILHEIPTKPKSYRIILPHGMKLNGSPSQNPENKHPRFEETSVNEKSTIKQVSSKTVPEQTNQCSVIVCSPYKKSDESHFTEQLSSVVVKSLPKIENVEPVLRNSTQVSENHVKIVLKKRLRDIVPINFKREEKERTVDTQEASESAKLLTVKREPDLLISDFSNDSSDSKLLPLKKSRILKKRARRDVPIMRFWLLYSLDHKLYGGTLKWVDNKPGYFALRWPRMTRCDRLDKIGDAWRIFLDYSTIKCFRRESDVSVTEHLMISKRNLRSALNRDPSIGVLCLEGDKKIKEMYFKRLEADRAEMQLRNFDYSLLMKHRMSGQSDPKIMDCKLQTDDENGSFGTDKLTNCDDQRLTSIISRLANNTAQPVEIKCEPNIYEMDESSDSSSFCIAESEHESVPSDFSSVIKSEANEIKNEENLKSFIESSLENKIYDEIHWIPDKPRHFKLYLPAVIDQMHFNHWNYILNYFKISKTEAPIPFKELQHYKDAFARDLECSKFISVTSENSSSSQNYDKVLECIICD